MFHSVWKNLQAIIAALEEIAEEPGEVKKKSRCLSKAGRVKTLPFLGTLLILIDFYDVWANLSKKLQTVNLLPHHRVLFVKKAIDKLGKMAGVVDANGAVDTH